MGEICPKLYPPLIRQKLISTPPSHNDYINATPPPQPLGKKSPPIVSLIASLLVGFLPPVHNVPKIEVRDCAIITWRGGG